MTGRSGGRVRAGLRGALLLALTLPACGQARAQGAASHPFTSTVWSIDGAQVTLDVTVPQATARLLVGRFIAVSSQTALARAVAARVGVRVGAQACAALDQGPDIGRIDTLAPEPGRYRFEIVFGCPRAGGLQLEDRLMSGIEGGIDFARIAAGGVVVTQLFDAAHPTLTVPPDGRARGASLWRYAGLGLWHALGAPSRIAFLAATLLGLRRRAELVLAAVGLLCGMVVSLAASLGPGLTIRTGLVEPTIGALVLLMAAAAALRQGARTGPLALGLGLALAIPALREALEGHAQHAVLLAGLGMFALACLGARGGAASAGGASAASWLAPVALFGLLDVAAFATPVVSLGLPGREPALPLAGFDAGDLLGSALVASLLIALHWLAGLGAPRGRAALRGPGALRLGGELGPALLVGFGAFWLFSRWQG